MFFVGRQRDLQQFINRMSLPVFVVDQDNDGEFRLVAANVAYAKATGLTSDGLLGKTPHMILPDEADAELFVSRYKACIRRRRPIAYSSEITYLDEPKAVDTILHPVSFDGGAPTRVVGQVTVTVAENVTTLDNAQVHHCPLNIPPDATISGAIDFVRDEVRFLKRSRGL